LIAETPHPHPHRKVNQTVRRYQSSPAGKLLLAMALAACMCSCGGASGGITSPHASPSCTTTPASKLRVPPVAGDFQRQADYVITCAGLRPAAERRANLKTPEGIVITSAPAQNAPIRADARLTLIVSAGSDGCGDCGGLIAGIRVMPDICGLTFQRAKTELAGNSITLDGQVRYRASSEPRGRIIGSAPAAGKPFMAYGNRKTAEAVAVTISSGPAPPSAQTPSPGSRSAC
jgi:beta-lactam-binding protein with PASTA domain